MTLTVDKAGRVILPKPLRDRLGLRPGAALEVEDTAEGVTLKPVRQRPTLVKGKKGLWVYTGEVPANLDIVRAIDDAREERIRNLAGL